MPKAKRRLETENGKDENSKETLADSAAKDIENIFAERKESSAKVGRGVAEKKSSADEKASNDLTAIQIKVRAAKADSCPPFATKEDSFSDIRGTKKRMSPWWPLLKIQENALPMDL
jgi:hypothetical protein